uniref:SET domain-containing protein n=1 Tax=Panagrolaimus davidi TaxID=227884 RepID=A0A914Q0F3_9BILA
MQIAAAKEAELLNQSKPVAWTPRNPFEEHMRWQMKLESFQATDFANVTRSTVLSSALSSKQQLIKLSPTTLKEMKVPKIHFGKYLICKVVDVPLPLIGISTLVEDLNGDVEEMIIYNFSYNINDVSWLKEGSILIIKEPRLRYGLQGKAVSLRIDSPTDIIFTDSTDEEFLSKIGASKWHKPSTKDVELIRKNANDLFLKGKFDDALMLYNRAIRYSPDLPILYLNKASAYLRKNSFSKAYEAAKFGLEKGGDREKALLRMGMAAYGMKQWKIAAKHFAEVLKDFAKNSSAEEQLKRATARLNEQEKGKFNFKEMYVMSKENAELDVSDYCGPIKITKIEGKGRGIVATNDIKKGTLLVVSKSFATSYSKDFTGNLISINLIRNNEVGTAAEMLQTIRAMENLHKNPQRAQEVYQLFSGNLDENDDENPDDYIDAARIQKICAFNCFSTEESIRGDHLKEDSHLFILPSYFNHSCIGKLRVVF